jgi:1-acyl-sn-glycerol-3-phosphate acyltransferase
MWWNYKKPKPLQDGAFSIAVMADVPVVPVFITMSDSDIVDNDGFFVQEYTINILKPIYKKDDLNKKDNINYLKDLNYNMWKEVYESYYKIPLKYTTKKENA